MDGRFLTAFSISCAERNTVSTKSEIRMNRNGNSLDRAIDSSKLRRIRSILHLAKVRADSTAAIGKSGDSAIAAIALHEALGTTDDDLTWLRQHELVEVKRRANGRRGKRRTGAVPGGNLYLVLSDAGLSWARRLCAVPPSNGRHPASGNGESQSDFTSAAATPSWDSDHGDWSVEGKLVKRLGEHASAQRLVLDAAENANWLNPISSPWAGLPPTARSAKLRRVIAQLNDHQREARVRIRTADKALHFVWWRDGGRLT